MRSRYICIQVVSFKRPEPGYTPGTYLLNDTTCNIVSLSIFNQPLHVIQMKQARKGRKMAGKREERERDLTFICFV